MKKMILAIMALVMMFPAIGTSAHEEVEIKKVEVTVTATNGGRVYCDGENWSALTGLELDRGTEITLEAVENRGRFVYWKDGISGKIVSDEPTYTFTLIDDVDIMAFFVPNNIMESYGYVTFADINGRIYLSNYAAGSSAKEPDTSWVNNPGYDLTGWDSDDWKDVAPGEIHLIRTVYEKKDDTYLLEVKGGAAEPALAEYSYDDTVVITADMADVPQGEYFAGWKLNGALASYDKAFGFRMGADTVAEAVYGASEPEELPIAAIIDVDTEIYDGGVSFIMLRNLPSGAELIESGILFAYGEGDPLTIDNASATKVKALGKASKGMYRYNKSLGTGVKLRAAAYMIYRIDGTLYVTYGEEKAVTK